MCLAEGIATAALVCDHVDPHRGDVTLFWSGPFQSLCKPHHDGAKQRQDLGRGPQAVDDEGWPATSSR